MSAKQEKPLTPQLIDEISDLLADMAIAHGRSVVNSRKKSNRRKSNAKQI